MNERQISGIGDKIIEYLFIIMILSIPFILIFYGTGSHRAVFGIKEPVQSAVAGGVTKQINDYDVDITFKYRYSVEALVVHKKNYGGITLSSKLAPVDAALAWGDVAAYNNRVNFHWSQRNRWYFWRVDSYEELDPVGDVYDVAYQSANNHLMPADKTAEKMLKLIRKGDHIRINGYLADVYAEKSDGSRFSWCSSVSRSDTGDGSCELIYVENVEWLD